MIAGKLDRRVTFQAPTLTDDGFASHISGWTDITTTWAEVTPVSDAERWRAGEVGATVTHRFVVRWQTALASLDPKNRAVFDGREYDITAVKEIGRRDGLEVTATARSD